MADSRSARTRSEQSGRTRATRTKSPAPPADLRTAVAALDDQKAQDIVVLDLRAVSDAMDFFVIASGSSDTHVRGAAERVLERLAETDVRPHHVEGLQAGRWVLLDFVDFVVHVFHPRLREYYQLERFWADAPTLDLLPER